MKSLRLLRNERRLLVKLCADSSQGCPVLESLDGVGVPDASSDASGDPVNADAVISR
ncbi:MAG: hypothetical protein ACYCZD_15575 [Rhodanobacter sp.]